MLCSQNLFDSEKWSCDWRHIQAKRKSKIIYKTGFQNIIFSCNIRLRVDYYVVVYVKEQLNVEFISNDT